VRSVVGVVENRHDPADHLAPISGQEELDFGFMAVVVERVMILVEELADICLERRYPVGIVSVEGEGQVDEGRKISAPGDPFDPHPITPSSRPTFAIDSSARSR